MSYRKYIYLYQEAVKNQKVIEIAAAAARRQEKY